MEAHEAVRKRSARMVSSVRMHEKMARPDAWIDVQVRTLTELADRIEDLESTRARRTIIFRGRDSGC